MRNWLRSLRIIRITAFLAIVLSLGAAIGQRAGVEIEMAATALPGSLTEISSSETPAEPTEYSFGGRELFPSYRLVGLYGSPSYPALGALGEQSLSTSIARVKKLALKHQPYSKETIIPMFELISTLASAFPTGDGDYSQEIEPAAIKPWVQAAGAADIYVVLDLQPGRDDFLSQAKEYEQLLSQPHVGLALDPEWRLKPSQVHLKQVGSVSAAEINKTAAWLSSLASRQNLPQKLLLIHQFKDSMITNKANVKTDYPNLAVVLQMDGHGAQAAKIDTWDGIRQDTPKGLRFGWKNFIDEDTDMFSPEATMNLRPKPWFVSYQ